METLFDLNMMHDSSIDNVSDLEPIDDKFLEAFDVINTGSSSLSLLDCAEMQPLPVLSTLSAGSSLAGGY
jgi:hypothetical protein